MWIRSQDKKVLIDAKTLCAGTLQKQKRDKNFNSILVGVLSASTLDNDDIIIGSFDTLEEALEELDRIQEHIAKSCPGVYQVGWRQELEKQGKEAI